MSTSTSTSTNGTGTEGPPIAHPRLSRLLCGAEERSRARVTWLLDPDRYARLDALLASLDGASGPDEARAALDALGTDQVAIVVAALEGLSAILAWRAAARRFRGEDVSAANAAVLEIAERRYGRREDGPANEATTTTTNTNGEGDT